MRDQFTPAVANKRLSVSADRGVQRLVTRAGDVVCSAGRGGTPQAVLLERSSALKLTAMAEATSPEMCFSRGSWRGDKEVWPAAGWRQLSMRAR